MFRHDLSTTSLKSTPPSRAHRAAPVPGPIPGPTPTAQPLGATAESSSGMGSNDSACGDSAIHVEPRSGGFRFDTRRRRTPDQRNSMARSPWLDGILAEERRLRERHRSPQPRRPSVASCSPSERLLSAWDAVLGSLELAIDAQTFAIWFRVLCPHSFVAGVWTVGCRAGTARWMTQRFGRFVESLGLRLEFVACGGMA
jgi:hypothetical protein